MDLTSQYNMPGNPFRPVDWRWRRATDLVANKRSHSPQHDDAGVRDAMHFVQALSHCRDDTERQNLVQRLPEASQAHTLYSGPPSFAKWELEARLLTDEPFVQVAAKCGLTSEVVELYEARYFCVRDALHAECYILSQVIGPKALSGLKEDDVDVIMKMKGYSSGSHALDALIDYYRDPPVLPERFEQLDAESLNALCAKLLIKASIVIDTLPINGSTLKKVALLREAVNVLRRRRVPAKKIEDVQTAPLQSTPIPDEQVFETSGRSRLTSEVKESPKDVGQPQAAVA